MYPAPDQTRPPQVPFGDPRTERLAHQFRWVLVALVILALTAAEVVETRWLLGS